MTRRIGESLLASLWWVYWSAYVVATTYWAHSAWADLNLWIPLSGLVGLVLPFGFALSRLVYLLIGVPLWLSVMLWLYCDLMAPIHDGWRWLGVFMFMVMAAVAIAGTAALGALLHSRFSRGQDRWREVVRHLTVSLALSGMMGRSTLGEQPVVPGLSLMAFAAMSALVFGVAGVRRGVIAGALVTAGGDGCRAGRPPRRGRGARVDSRVGHSLHWGRRGSGLGCAVGSRPPAGQSVPVGGIDVAARTSLILQSA